MTAGAGFLLAVLWFDLMFKPHSTAEASKDQETVAGLDTQYQAAVKVNDAATMDRILADDFTLVTGSGKTYSKADLLAEARSGNFHYEHQEDTNQTVRIWGDTAVVTAFADDPVGRLVVAEVEERRLVVRSRCDPLVVPVHEHAFVAVGVGMSVVLAGQDAVQIVRLLAGVLTALEVGGGARHIRAGRGRAVGACFASFSRCLRAGDDATVVDARENDDGMAFAN